MQRIMRYSFLPILALAVAGCASAPTATTAFPDKDPFGPLDWLISPTQGRPAMVRLGGTLLVQFRVPRGFAGKAELRLFDAAAPDRAGGSRTLALARPLDIAAYLPTPGELRTKATESAEPLASAVANVPADLPPGLYDLGVTLYDKMKAVQRVKLVPRSVAAYADFPRSFRFVQLSKMSIGGLTAPTFPDELVEEVNRIAPEFIVTTGDYTEWAAVRDDPKSWRAIKGFFAKFDAPVFLMVGDLDHDAGFQQFVAPSCSGRFFFGGVQGILLYDSYRHPIDADQAQFLWLESVLTEPPQVQFNFLVSPNDSLRVFDAWRKLGWSPRDYVRRNRIGMIFVGGYGDWDFSEQSAKVADAPVHYIRTHASSTCIRGKATGVPHYRIVQIDQTPAPASRPDDEPAFNTNVTLSVPENGPVQHALHSVPVGLVRVSFDGANDGSADHVGVHVLNRLTIPIPRLRVKVNVAPGKSPLVAVGGTIERVIDRPGRREVWLRIDAPDLGAAAAVVGPAGAMPKPRGGVKLALLGDPVLQYRTARTADGFEYFATDGQLQLQMVNAAAQPADAFPIIRLNGNALSLRGVSPTQPIRLAPGEQRTLPINTPLALAAPGEHWMTANLADESPVFTSRKVVQLLVSEGVPATQSAR
ncbi:MAG: hypothetical protein PHU85_14195 [Phycisphaerae bacterium]|nr:hypothetical protein [Phycisphaerae bacterium]